MIPTNGLPAQQTTPTLPVRTAPNADRTSVGTASSPAPQGFDALLAKLGAELEANGQAVLEAGPVEGEIEGLPQPRRLRGAQDKPLEANDALPMELLLTLLAQQQPPQASALPALNAGLSIQDAASPVEMPQQPNALAMQAAAAASQAVADLPKAGATPSEGGRMAQSGRDGWSTAMTQTMPQLPDNQTATLPVQVPVPPDSQTSALPAPANAPLPADSIERLAVAAKPVTPGTVTSQAPKHSVAAHAEPATSLPLAAPAVAQQQTAAPEQVTTAVVAAATVAQPQTQAAAPKPINPAAHPWQPPSGEVADSRANEPATPRGAVADALVQEPEQIAKKDGAPPPPERQRDIPTVITRQETVFTTGGQPPVAHQAAERIIAALQSTDGSALADRTQLARAADAATPVRMLHIQLQPADLGTLNVTLSLRDQVLDIKLEAAEHRTARMLETDREKLTEILRSAGYSLDGVTVQISSPEKPVQPFTAMPGQGGSNHAQYGGQSQPGGAQADTQRGQGSRQGNDERSFASTNDGGDHASRPGSSDGDLYL